MLLLTMELITLFYNRYLDLIFNGAAMVTGMILMSTSNVFTDPFFAFSRNLLVVFSVAVGWHMFKIFQNICDFDKSAKHSKITSLLRLVAVVHYSLSLIYKQSALLGTIGLIVEGHASFFKLDKLLRTFKVSPKSWIHFISVLLTCISAVLLRAAFPLFALAVTILHWNQLLFMDYIPLAVFFLCLVFYTAANLWFLKVAFDPIVKFKSCQKKKQQDGYPNTTRVAVPCYIHNDLWSGRGQSSININLNSSSSVRYSSPQSSINV